MPKYTLKWFVNGHQGIQKFLNYEEAIDIAYVFISINKHCYVSIYNGRDRIFSYEKLMKIQVKN